MPIVYLNPEGSSPSASAPPLSSAVRAGDFVFTSGQLPRDSTGALIEADVGSQAAQALANLMRALALADCNVKDVVKVTVWLADIDDLPEFNRVYADFFGACRPARSTTQAKLVGGAAVEIEALAYRPLAAQT
ncbi:RidA family protein [Paraburkholderia rhizosphaerae]|uniref:Reactive intermediate/imine deaminase n=1 Tax=Paraburkholderia rhizosphaerae TaxID=480658 RepID=A0A4R8LIS8_9BURK|nr:RidA family protein [Paraburkholderia rhizosphaerae]TDY42765.1 reactive intermediate/imine deaminase [Paraburkholderia rhizosphaerae]